MGVVLLYVFVLPWILNALVGLPFAVKLVVSAVLLAPLGFAMGMPFPSGLRALARTQTGEAKDNAVEWAWAMNAGSSVLGSVLAMVIAIQFGLNVTLACGAGAYLTCLADVSGALRPQLHGSSVKDGPWLCYDAGHCPGL